MARYCVYSGGSGVGGAIAGTLPTAGEWAAAYVSLSACLTAVTEADGDIIFVADDHNASYGVSTVITTAAFVYIISTNRTTNQQAVGTATETTSGNFGIALTGVGAYVFGLTLKPGTGASSGSTTIGLASTVTTCNFVFDSCNFIINSTNAAPGITVGGTDIAGTHKVSLKNCTFKLGNTAQKITLAGSELVELYNCSIDNTSITPAVGLTIAATRGSAKIKAEGCNFAGCTNLLSLVATNYNSIQLTSCLIPNSPVTGTALIGGTVAEFFGCGATTDSYQYRFEDGSGSITHNTGVYLTTGGASFANTAGALVPLSLMLVSNATASKAFPLYTPWLNTEVTATGSKTFTVNVATLSALNTNDLWLEIEYMGTAGTPITSSANTFPAIASGQLDILNAGSALTDSAAGADMWTGLTSELVYNLAKTVTIAKQGFARIRIGLAKPTSTLYVDPQVTVS